MALTNIILIIYRYKENKKAKNISFLLKLRNKIFKIFNHYILLVIEILIHLIQPYPYISETWSINTLDLNVTYNINSILACMAIMRLYVCMRVLKNSNMYNAMDIMSVNHYNLSSVYRFLYRCNLRYRPFITILIIFAFFYYISIIAFILYERYNLTGEFTNIWNVFWLIVVTITTSIY
jgi:hypothetical protein